MKPARANRPATIKDGIAIGLERKGCALICQKTRWKKQRSLTIYRQPPFPDTGRAVWRPLPVSALCNFGRSVLIKKTVEPETRAMRQSLLSAGIEDRMTPGHNIAIADEPHRVCTASTQQDRALLRDTEIIDQWGNVNESGGSRGVVFAG
jgi:hypothetical protein